MDSITHSLIGITAAEAAIQWHGSWKRLSSKTAEPVTPSQRLALWAASILANNAPDLDLIYSRLLPHAPTPTMDRLTYLLLHRGFTHTIAGAILQTILFERLLRWICRWKLPLQGETLHAVLAPLIFAGFLLHIYADSWNSYGVHPFWPLNNQWFYGDLMFIAEPTLWLSMLPLAFFTAPRIWLKILFAGMFAGTGVLMFTSHMVPVLNGVMALAWGAVCAAIFRMIKRPTRKAIFGVCAPFLVVATFATTEFISRITVKLKLHSNPRDVILSPHPADPSHWYVVVVDADAQNYRLRRGMFRLGPQELTLEDAFEAPLADFTRLKSTHCDFAAFLKFARAPAWREHDGWLDVWDMRFQRDGTRGFTALQFKAQETSCPKWLPPWREPIAF